MIILGKVPLKLIQTLLLVVFLFFTFHCFIILVALETSLTNCYSQDLSTKQGVPVSSQSGWKTKLPFSTLWSIKFSFPKSSYNFLLISVLTVLGFIVSIMNNLIKNTEKMSFGDGTRTQAKLKAKNWPPEYQSTRGQYTVSIVSIKVHRLELLRI